MATMLLVLCSTSGVHAQAGAVAGSFIVFPAGWNLISFGSSTFTLRESLLQNSLLYTFQANDSAYEAADPQHLTPGEGYWVYLAAQHGVTLPASGRFSTSTIIPGGQCVMVGNPSTAASARVSGATRVYVFSTLLNMYIEEPLVGIGRGAWACNDNATSTMVMVTDEGDVLTADFPACCTPRPFAGAGRALLAFRNDSPYPLLAGLRQVDAVGQFMAVSTMACSACPEYTPAEHDARGCSRYAVAGDSVALPPGQYLLHMQSDGPNVPDLQGVITLDANTSYQWCYYVSSTRPQKTLP